MNFCQRPHFCFPSSKGIRSHVGRVNPPGSNAQLDNVTGKISRPVLPARVSPLARVFSGACIHSVQFFENVFQHVPFQRPKMYSCIHRVHLQNSRRKRQVTKLAMDTSPSHLDTKRGREGGRKMKTRPGKRPPGRRSHLRLKLWGPWPPTAAASAPPPGSRCPQTAAHNFPVGWETQRPEKETCLSESPNWGKGQ